MKHTTKILAALVMGALSLSTVGFAAAREADADGLAPAPAQLLRIDELLMFGENELVDECNTHPIGFETWTAYGRGAEYDRVMHNGEESTVEMLERAILEAEGQDWTQIFSVANNCAKAGGWCACASIAWSTRAVFCAACCPSGTRPFCICDGLYAYASCGCYVN